MQGERCSRRDFNLELPEVQLYSPLPRPLLLCSGIACRVQRKEGAKEARLVLRSESLQLGDDKVHPSLAGKDLMVVGTSTSPGMTTFPCF